MRGKRSKQYRKLMQQYSMTFGFREPYQVVVDAEMVHDAHRFAMDLAPALARTLHGDVKVMITQCSIRHLFGLPTISSTSTSNATSSSKSTSTPSPSAFLTTPIDPSTKTALLQLARTFTLRRCNHHLLPEPLSPLGCVSAVLDPKGRGANPHRLILAVQHGPIRAWARASVRGAPAIYIKRSVMVMEPMSLLSQGVREGWERGKIFKDGNEDDQSKKRGRGEDDDDDEEDEMHELQGDEGKRRAEKKRQAVSDAVPLSKTKTRKRKKAKGPNPLSVKKKVKAKQSPAQATT